MKDPEARAPAPPEQVAGGPLARLASLLRRIGRAFRDYLRNPNVPRRDKLAAVAGILYFLIPGDLIPDLLLPLGFADDALVLGAVGLVVRRAIGRAARQVAGDVVLEPVRPALDRLRFAGAFVALFLLSALTLYAALRLLGG